MKSCSNKKKKIFSMQTLYILFLLPLASCLARKVKRCPIWEGEKVVSSFTISSSRMSTNLVVTASKSNYKKHRYQFPRCVPSWSKHFLAPVFGYKCINFISGSKLFHTVSLYRYRYIFDKNF